MTQPNAEGLEGEWLTLEEVGELDFFKSSKRAKLKLPTLLGAVPGASEPAIKAVVLVTQEIFSSKISMLAVKKAMEQIHAQCGNATDPVERMMLEQLTLAHHSIGRLMAKAATADNLEHAEMYHSMSARLLGEIGRLALCIKSYRDSSN